MNTQKSNNNIFRTRVLLHVTRTTTSDYIYFLNIHQQKIDLRSMVHERETLNELIAWQLCRENHVKVMRMRRHTTHCTAYMILSGPAVYFVLKICPTHIERRIVLILTKQAVTHLLH